ncbi:protein PHOTOSYSTEM I ASSEMBLY 2, chloroplastic-like [Selaginella moellendorffii]|uniref:protein PHOTOSYSTEM I ASSEMBLY 2, chloroplastic-like n=1 Tax=Selaginella moellendorffii TaxID=88036 RepID=UPI000D1CFABB|nr:protein PHOTOSYSTEM I ASSEMBLY 2, chloroplastic-like [Selaginella moellendorffii]|eukprot:XP_024537694.1 protein PHOTOSYSTEM I ASSEMBLY 2, chloroplastic-like [Selaginella moellendorffii]
MDDPGWAVMATIFALQFAATTLARNPRWLLSMVRIKPKKCKECLGTGYNLCLMCKARGKQGGLFTGSPLEKCSLCQGRGKISCVRCAGTGIANRLFFRLKKSSR